MKRYQLEGVADVRLWAEVDAETEQDARDCAQWHYDPDGVAAWVRKVKVVSVEEIPE